MEGRDRWLQVPGRRQKVDGRRETAEGRRQKVCTTRRRKKVCTLASSVRHVYRVTRYLYT